MVTRVRAHMDTHRQSKIAGFLRFNLICTNTGQISLLTNASIQRMHTAYNVCSSACHCTHTCRCRHTHTHHNAVSALTHKIQPLSSAQRRFYTFLLLVVPLNQWNQPVCWLAPPELRLSLLANTLMHFVKCHKSSDSTRFIRDDFPHREIP